MQATSGSQLLREKNKAAPKSAEHEIMLMARRGGKPPSRAVLRMKSTVVPLPVSTEPRKKSVREE